MLGVPGGRSHRAASRPPPAPSLCQRPCCLFTAPPSLSEIAAPRKAVNTPARGPERPGIDSPGQIEEESSRRQHLAAFGCRGGGRSLGRARPRRCHRRPMCPAGRAAAWHSRDPSRLGEEATHSPAGTPQEHPWVPVAPRDIALGCPREGTRGWLTSRAGRQGHGWVTEESARKRRGGGHI